MAEFSLNDRLIPELRRNLIYFKIIECNNEGGPVSIITYYRYFDICRVDYYNRIGSNNCYRVVWHTRPPYGFDKIQYFTRASDLVHYICEAIKFNFKGGDKVDNKMYRVTDVKFKSDKMNEIDLTINVLRSKCAVREDFEKIREAIESIKTHDDSIDALTYCKADIISTYRLIQMFNKTSIEDVIFNNPATIVFWGDGTKTVVKAENEEFDPEKGLAMAIAKKALGNNYDYYDIFKKYVGRYEKKQKKGN